jgi:hypothetical protein
MLNVTGPRTVAVLETTLIGGGVPAVDRTIIGTDLRSVRSLWFTPRRTGTYGIEVRAVDVAGCVGSTAGQVRNVVVR